MILTSTWMVTLTSEFMALLRRTKLAVSLVLRAPVSSMWVVTLATLMIRWCTLCDAYLVRCMWCLLASLV